jgi:secreted PhoX family phosphatase
VVLDGSALYVATKHDQTISRLDLERSRLTTFWQGEPIRGPDNLAVHGVTHDLYVCEDGGNMEVVIVSPEQEAAPFLRFVGHLGSEVTGAAFDPSGTRLFVNSQRAGTARKLEDLVGEGGDLSIGRTYMITGPF